MTAARVADGPAPGAFVSGYLAYLLARTSRLISAEFHAQLAHSNVPVMHWRVMAALFDGPLPVTAVAEIALAKAPTISKLIERMEELQLVRRRADKRDRRCVLVSLTPKGRRLAVPLVAQARAHEEAVLRPFGDDNAALLIDTLRHLIETHAGTHARTEPVPAKPGPRAARTAKAGLPKHLHPRLAKKVDGVVDGMPNA